MQCEIIKYIEANKEKHYRMAYSYVRNEQDALDIVQDTIVKALKNQDSIKHKEYLGTWFCRILINTCKTYLKKQNKYVYVEEVEIRSRTISDKEQALEIEEAMSQLLTHEKTVLLLRYYEELELKEIAQLTEQNISTVKSTLYRSVRKLKALLDKK